MYLLPLTSERVALLLLLLLPSAVAIAFSDVVIDAMMITAGQPRGMTGRLQSIQWTSMYAATIVTGVAGGALSQWGMQQAGFLVAGLSCGISLLAVWFLVRERRQPADACEGASPSAKCNVAGGRNLPPSHAIAEMWQTFREPGIIAIGAFLFLWSFNPFSSTVLYYYSTEALHFSEQFVGSLTSWHAVGLLTGSVLYGVICRMIPIRWLIHGSIVAGILATIAYWGYRDATSGVAISLAVGVVYAIGSLIQLDLAARGVAGNRGNDIRAAHVADQSRHRALPGYRRIDLRSDGRAVGVRIGISDAGRSGGIVHRRLLALDATSKSDQSFATQGEREAY